jgi:hypothetical protein
MPRRKENSVAAARVRPMAMAKRMVAPARDVPGKTAARICAIATTMAMPQVTSVRRVRSVTDHSMIRMRTPPHTVAQAMGQRSFGSSAPSFREISTPTMVTTKATASFPR